VATHLTPRTGADIREIGPDDDLAALADLAHRAFGPGAVPHDPAGPARQRARTDQAIAGHRVFGAFAGGRILNAKTAQSQYLGGIIQGIGMALLEQTHLDRRLGAYTNVNLAENLVPVNADIRSVDVILVPEDDPHVNPIGAKGIGEVGIVGVAPAIANAVCDALADFGVELRSLPITPESIWRAIRDSAALIR